MTQHQIRGNAKLGQPKGARTKLQTGALASRAWWAMRRMQRFTKPELLCTVATSDDAKGVAKLGSYLRALTRAGILTVEAKRVPGKVIGSNGHLRYRLEINCGHKSPVWRIKSKQVYDPNNGITYYIGDEIDAKEAEVSHA